MKKWILVLALAVIGAPALAQTLPPAVLDKEYQSCLKEATPANLARMTAYCQCVRNKMATWNAQTYNQVAEEVAKSGENSPILQALAKACVQQTGP